MLQSNLSNMDTEGTEQNFCIRGVLFTEVTTYIMMSLPRVQ